MQTWIRISFARGACFLTAPTYGYVGWRGGCEAGQAGLHRGGMGDSWGRGGAAPGASPASE
eukprot:1184705-Prorocentrum_minimum.AAC.7